MSIWHALLACALGVALGLLWDSDQARSAVTAALAAPAFAALRRGEP